MANDPPLDIKTFKYKWIKEVSLLYFFFFSCCTQNAPNHAFLCTITTHNIQYDFLMMEGLSIAELPVDRRRESCWQAAHLTARLGGSMRERAWHITEKHREREKERVSADQISSASSLSISEALSDPLLVCYICPTCILIFLSMSNVSLSLSVLPSRRLPSIPLIWPASQLHSPIAHECVGACVCMCAYVRRIISEEDVCQNKGLISFKKNYNLCTHNTQAYTELICFLSSPNPSILGGINPLFIGAISTGLDKTTSTSYRILWFLF